MNGLLATLCSHKKYRLVVADNDFGVLGVLGKTIGKCWGVCVCVGWGERELEGLCQETKEERLELGRFSLAKTQ